MQTLCTGHALHPRNINLEGKRQLGRPRRRWVDNIRMDLGEVGWSDVDWIDLAQDMNRWRALANSVLNLRVSVKCWETIEWPNI
jgi:hypothetical protein